MRIGLALSGGGARGVGHLGILKAMDECEIKISMITGASAGAIVGAFYCSGYAPEEVMEIIKSVKLYRYLRPAMSRSGLLKMDPAENIYKKYIKAENITELKIPLAISATNVRRGKNKIFDKGPLIKAVMASSAVPVVFEPVTIDDEQYIDGGILNNLPIEPLLDNVDKIIAVNCNPIDDDYQTGNMKSLLERSLLMAINMNAYAKKPLCDFYLEPEGLKKFGGMDFSRAQEMFDIGYEYGHRIIPSIAQKLMIK